MIYPNKGIFSLTPFEQGVMDRINDKLWEETLKQSVTYIDSDTVLNDRLGRIYKNKNYYTNKRKQEVKRILNSVYGSQSIVMKQDLINRTKVVTSSMYGDFGNCQTKLIETLVSKGGE